MSTTLGIAVIIGGWVAAGLLAWALGEATDYSLWGLITALSVGGGCSVLAVVLS